MKPPRRPGSPTGGAWRPAWRYVLLALAALAGAAWLLSGLLSGPVPAGADTASVASMPATPPPAASRAATAPVSLASAAVAAAPAAPAVVRTASAPAPEASDDLAAHIPAGQVPTMNQVIEGLHQRGIRTGLGAFNPPGTRPPLIGLAVPEAFELPPGYLRHHQATDDGQPIEAILMFDPDHPPPAAAGRSLATPATRVVPPELAPPGLPIRLITLPPTADPGSPRR